MACTLKKQTTLAKVKRAECEVANHTPPGSWGVRDDNVAPGGSSGLEAADRATAESRSPVSHILSTCCSPPWSGRTPARKTDAPHPFTSPSRYVTVPPPTAGLESETPEGVAPSTGARLAADQAATAAVESAVRTLGLLHLAQGKSCPDLYLTHTPPALVTITSLLSNTSSDVL